MFAPMGLVPVEHRVDRDDPVRIYALVAVVVVPHDVVEAFTV